MKELEALQEILRGAKTTFVLGRGELADQIGRLAARRPQDAGVCVEEDAAGDN
jgi:hypothetical protein